MSSTGMVEALRQDTARSTESRNSFYFTNSPSKGYKANKHLGVHENPVQVVLVYIKEDLQ